MDARALFFNKPLDYEDCVRFQERLVELRLKEEQGDTVLFLEHYPVVTLGNRGRDHFLKKTPDQLAEQGIAFAHASRGGDVTFHGPGQLVLYPVLHLGASERDSHGYLWNLEEIAIRTAASFGVEAWRRTGKNGAWCSQGKLAAIGFRLKRWVVYHGMSFNVCPDMSGFSTIVPCGLVGEPVTSLEEVLGLNCPDVVSVRNALALHVEDVLGRRLRSITVDNLAEAALQLGI